MPAPRKNKSRSSVRPPSPRPAAPLPSVTVIGLGNWGAALASALHRSGVPLRQLVVRRIRPRHRALASALGVPLASWDRADFDAEVYWICTPDASIAEAAARLAQHLAVPPASTAPRQKRPPIVFHSSGALPSQELAPLRAVHASLASVHPLMTFPRRTASRSARPISLAGIPFAIEGEARALRVARTLLRALEGEPFPLPAAGKPLYHAFGAFASPLLAALLTAAAHTAQAAGCTPRQATQRMRPIVQQTVANFFLHGPDFSFSGPMARGDVATVARHLQVMRPHPELAAVYRALSLFALVALPSRNARALRRLLQSPRANRPRRSGPASASSSPFAASTA